MTPASVTHSVEGITKTMTDLKKPYTALVYEGAGRGFLREQAGRTGANLKGSKE